MWHLVGKIILEGGCDTSQIILCEYLLTLLFVVPALSRGMWPVHVAGINSGRETNADISFHVADCLENSTLGTMFWGNCLKPFNNKLLLDFSMEEKILEEILQHCSALQTGAFQDTWEEPRNMLSFFLDCLTFLAASYDHRSLVFCWQ